MLFRMNPHDPDRRHALKTGLGALLAMGAFNRLSNASFAPRGNFFPPLPPSLPRQRLDPVLRLETLGISETIEGLPFAPTWFADSFANGNLPFHACESCVEYPPAAESIDVAIIGGGLSGLALAHQLRHRNTVLFELRTRLGGNAMGESFNAQSWSLASAYFMQDDKGAPLQNLYEELGLPSLWRQDNGSFSFEYDGAITEELLGRDPNPKHRAALAAYQAAVKQFAFNDYPDIPFEGAPSELILELDSRSFRDDLLLRCGELPPRLQYLLQAYCTSSLGVGTDELSAAAAWNFVAAEEFGRNVLPAGNAGLARALWQQARVQPNGMKGAQFRAGATVGEVQLTDGGALVFWRDAEGKRHTTFARQVAFANAKHIVRHMLPWLDAADPAKREAMQLVPTVPYLVANVVLNAPLGHDFYDLYLNGSAAFPQDANTFESTRIITDAVNGGFAVDPTHNGVLSIYWPLPWHTARFTIVHEEDWRNYAARAAPQLKTMLALLKVAPEAVAQIRISRWGHAMPFAQPGAYSSGLPNELRRPLNDRLWFVNQDNWLLPAVETALTEALWAAPQIDSALA
ncbi:MAG: hypothetical protein EXS10_01360 [Phycisphaerales bacterium]|nr:hypothetical protein [Phycisphaerales bacterium]